MSEKKSGEGMQEQAAVQQGQVRIHKIYVKDISFETNSEFLLQSKQPWKPQIDVEINTKNRTLTSEEEMRHEVVLHVLVKAHQEGTMIFLVEVQHGGIFSVDGLSPENTKAVLNANCPDILFPFVREVVHGLVAKGGFPQLLLAPVNFEQLYRQKLASMQAQQTPETRH